MLFSPIIALTALMAGGPALADVSLDRSIQLRGTHFCLDNTDGVLEDGNRLQIYDCWGEDKDQKWVWEQVEVWNDIPLYHIRLDGTDKCVAFKRPKKGSAAGAFVVLAACDSDLQTYYTKWRWDQSWICSGIGRCIGVQAQEPHNGATLGMSTTNNAEWVTPK